MEIAIKQFNQKQTLKSINESESVKTYQIKVIYVYSIMMVSNTGLKWIIRLIPVLANLVYWGISCTVKVFMCTEIYIFIQTMI